MSISALGIFSAAGAGRLPQTYELISTTILGSNQPSITFSNLATVAAPYRHLQIRATTRTTRASTVDVVCMRFNSDTGANYAIHRLQGNGSSVASAGNASQPNQFIGLATGASATANQFAPAVVDILDAFSTTKNKTTRAFTGTTNDVVLYSNAWFNTNALTQIEIFPINLDNFVAGSRFSLYGIRG